MHSCESLERSRRRQAFRCLTTSKRSTTRAPSGSGWATTPKMSVMAVSCPLTGRCAAAALSLAWYERRYEGWARIVWLGPGPLRCVQCACCSNDWLYRARGDSASLVYVGWGLFGCCRAISAVVLDEHETCRVEWKSPWTRFAVVCFCCVYVSVCVCVMLLCTGHRAIFVEVSPQVWG